MMINSVWVIKDIRDVVTEDVHPPIEVQVTYAPVELKLVTRASLLVLLV